ncbi:MAG: hypothetical protein J6J79_09590 [Lachnospiraceae bacterium]|nr:hypothetical protein [Lachnospiraceae bacterium]
MELKDFFKKYENFIGTCILLLIIMVFTALRYDYYYDLNDDVLMKDILAGVYTGEPEGHNIQMLWLISAIISLFYKVVRGLPWYGLFLCTCHYGSIGLIAHRSLSFCSKLSTKILLLFAEGALIIGLLLQHLVSAQYTFTCTLLVAAATFLFLTTESTLPVKEFVKKNIISVLLVFLAYLVRSEMCLLVLPLVCVAGVMKWGSESKIFVKENVIKYISVIGAILGGILIGQISHMIAYGSSEWKTFTEYFDNRTELYDFQQIPEYEPHQAFYESVGLAESERQLLENYNFGLNEEIDEKLLGKIAAYAAENRKADKPFIQNLKESTGHYIRRTVYGPGNNESDYPWNYIILFSYLAVFVTALFDREKKFVSRFFQITWKLVFLGGVRSVLWLWLIMRDRVPPRISHSMYVMELCILFAMVLLHCKGRFMKLFTGALYGFMGVAFWQFSFMTTDMDVAQKAQNNVPYEELYSYFKQDENKDNFYFVDVYSSVAYTEKMFADVDNSLDNYDIMGGWACKSPLYRKKLAAYGMDSMEEALLTKPYVYYVQKPGKDTDWLYAYYEEQGVSIMMKPVDTPLKNFEIYQLEAEHESK